MGDSVSSRTRFATRLRLRDTVTNDDSLCLEEASASLLSPLAQQSTQPAGSAGADQTPLLKVLCYGVSTCACPSCEPL